MSVEEIVRFLSKQENKGKEVQVDFKKRAAINGLFVEGTDFADLKSKNFWRIVSRKNMEEWEKSRDMGLAKIFNGMEFHRLTSLAAVNKNKRVVATPK